MKRNIVVSLLLTVVAAFYTLLVKFVDLGAIGPEKSVVGFSTINRIFSNFIGVHMTLYNISELIGLIPILMAIIFGCIGVKQLITRKSLFKVDKELFVLGGFYAVIMILYAFFEVVIINYRPTLIDGVLEASYPSSHTLMSLCICGSTIILCRLRYRRKCSKLLICFSTIIMVCIVLFRLLSGVHWFSDILGGMIISSALLMVFSTVIQYIGTKR